MYSLFLIPELIRNKIEMLYSIFLILILGENTEINLTKTNAEYRIRNEEIFVFFILNFIQSQDCGKLKSFCLPICGKNRKIENKTF